MKKWDKYSSKKGELQKFTFLCSLNQKEIKQVVFENLITEGYLPISESGFLFAQGELPILLVAHLDTVHKELPTKFVFDEYKNIISSPTGIGGDDRCGIYIILKLIKDLKCSVLFCEDEEAGGIGAKLFSKSKYIEYLDNNINFILEFDRKGEKECIFYNCANDEFERFIIENGLYVTGQGSYTDICEVAPAMSVAGVNLSCGYYNEHTLDEFVNITEMNQAVKKAEKIIKKSSKKFDYIANNQWNDLDYMYGYYGEENLYGILYRDKGVDNFDEEFAFSTYEAIGKFLSHHVNLTFLNIDDIEII